MRIVLTTLLFVVALCNAQATAAPKAAHLTVSHEAFVLTMPDGKQLRTRNLIGATLDMTTPDGAEIALRIDGAHPAKERPSLLLLDMSMRVGAKRMPFCEKDYYGRAAGFPVSGAWSANGRFIADPKRWFITCTSGSQGKCILFGYGPWDKGPMGQSLVPYYEACQRMVRADYDGSGTSHTKNGTIIDIYDTIGIEKADMLNNKAFHFEAGWRPTGAVCVAKTRWGDLLTLKELVKRAPRLAGRCSQKIAAAKGAILFNGSR